MPTPRKERPRKSRPVIVGLRVRRLREALGWTQLDLAAKTEMLVPELSNIENDKQDVRAARLKDLAVALGVSADFLLGLSETSDRAVGLRVRRADS